MSYATLQDMITVKSILRGLFVAGAAATLIWFHFRLEAVELTARRNELRSVGNDSDLSMHLRVRHGITDSNY